VVQQCGEPFLLVLLCYFSYTFKPLGHAYPAPRPARALLARVSLGPLSLGSTDSAPGGPGLFASFVATSERSDFSCPCFIGLDSSSSRCGPLPNS
jgi:hypothetical protein